VKILPTETLSMLSGLNEKNLPELASIETPVTTRAPGGVTTTGWLVTRTSPCRVSPAGGTSEERLLADQLREVATFVVVFPASFSVKPDERIVVTGATAKVPWTKRLAVIGMTGPRTNEVMRKVLCSNVEFA